MRLSCLIMAMAALPSGIAAAQQSQEPQLLPTGQALTPLAAPGARFEPLTTGIGPVPSYLADGAAAAATSPDGREMLVLTSGYNRVNGADGKVIEAQSVQYVFRYAVSARGSRLLQTLPVKNSYGGIAWRPDGRGFLVGGGVDDVVHVFARRGTGFAETATIELGHKAGLGAEVKPQAAGVAVSPDGHRALVANYYNDSASLLDLDRNAVVAEQDLRPGKIDPAQAGVAGGENPFAVVWPEPGRAWLSSPRDRQIVALAIGSTGISVTGRIATLGEPTALLADRRSGRLFATEDNADRLAIVDTAAGRLAASN
ncbi:YncE family protein [Sphingomonas bacterium]|uniref:YncE family protein n=1 Tax=Sphingomonas bacterium TaxID=1895847 RepID=UPI0020C63CD5|nr:hypothetical protein [Sphingomonas bacterium]